MNKILIVGRLVRKPETNITQTGIKYSRFTVAVTRPFGDKQSDFIPAIAWRNQAEFIDKYLDKGALVSAEGRFTSSTFTNAENQNITRYEILVDRIEALETKAMVNARKANTGTQPTEAAATQIVELEKARKELNTNKKESKNDDSNPWSIDL